MRRAQTDQRWDEIDAAAVGHLAGQPLDFGRGPQYPQPIAEPLDHRPGHEDRTFQTVRHLAVEMPADRGQQIIFRRYRALADVHQHETAGAVGVLCAAGRKTRLAEGGRLLVAENAGDRDRTAEPFFLGLSIDFARRPDLGQHRAGNVEDPQQFVVPIERVDVEQQRSAGVAVIGDMPPSAGQTPHEPTIDRAEEDFAFLGSRSEFIVGVQQILDLRAAKIRIDDQTGLFAEHRLAALGLQPIADARA